MHTSFVWFAYLEMRIFFLVRLNIYFLYTKSSQTSFVSIAFIWRTEVAANTILYQCWPVVRIHIWKCKGIPILRSLVNIDLIVRLVSIPNLIQHSNLYMHIHRYGCTYLIHVIHRVYIIKNKYLYCIMEGCLLVNRAWYLKSQMSHNWLKGKLL